MLFLPRAVLDTRSALCVGARYGRQQWCQQVEFGENEMGSKIVDRNGVRFCSAVVVG